MDGAWMYFLCCMLLYIVYFLKQFSYSRVKHEKMNWFISQPYDYIFLEDLEFLRFGCGKSQILRIILMSQSGSSIGISGSGWSVIWHRSIWFQLKNNKRLKNVEFCNSLDKNCWSSHCVMNCEFLARLKKLSPILLWLDIWVSSILNST